MNSKIAAAKQAISAGRRTDALVILRDLVNEEPNNIHAWLYLAGLAPNAAARESCLKRAESINPDHPMVQKARNWSKPQPNQEERQPDPVPAVAPAATAVQQPEPVVTVSAAAIATARPTPQAAVQPPPSAQTNEKSSNRTVWITAGVVAVLLFITAGALIISSAWFNTLWAVEPAAEAVVGEANIAAEVAVASDEENGDTAATPAPADDRFNNEGRQAATENDDNGGSVPAGKLIVESDEVRERWTATPSPTHTPSPTPTPTATPTIPPTFVSQSPDVVPPVFLGPNEKWIDVNLTTQTLNAYEGNKLVFSTLISSGLAQYPTVTGQFRVYLEYESQTMDGRYLGYDYVVENVPYVLYFYQGYAIHGAYWHDNFGNPMSHGCVNMEVSEAQWIYQWAGIGTLVNVHY